MDGKKDKSEEGVPTLRDEDIKTQPRVSRRLFFLKGSAATGSLLVASGCISVDGDPVDFDSGDPIDSDGFDPIDTDSGDSSDSD